MRIDSIKINKFGCHSNLNLNFTEGVNIVAGQNESGKSTLLAFIRAVLYGFDSRTSDNPRKKYLPWGSKADDHFGGEIIFSHKGNTYRAVALFTQSKRTDVITLYNDVTGQVISIPDGNTIGEYVLGLTAGAFDCSVFASQLDSKGDFTKDKNGLLFNKLTNVSNTSTESSQEAGRRLKKAVHQITNRSGDGILDKLYKKSEILKETLNSIDSRQAQVSQLFQDLEQLSEDEEKLKNRRSYYMQFSDIKKAFNVLDSRKAVIRKQKEIEDIERDIESLTVTMDPTIYDDIQPKTSGLFVFLFLLFLLLFGSGVFATIFVFLEALALYYTIGAGVGTLLMLLLSILCLLKIKKTPTLPNNLDEENNLLEQFEFKKSVAQEELFDLTQGLSSADLEEKWKIAADLIESAELTEDTLKYIKQCPPDLLEEKIETATKELMEIQQRISYVRGNLDSVNNQGSVDGSGAFNDGKNIYDAIEETEAAIRTYKTKLEALQLAMSVLEQSEEEVQNTFGPVINRYTQQYLTAMTGKDFGKIRINSDFQVSVFDSENLAGHSSSDYSGATEDQIYLAMRFAFTKIIGGDNDSLPLFLDDPFVQYDDLRHGKTLKFMKDFTAETDTQIILSTCHNRDLSPLEDYNYITL